MSKKTVYNFLELEFKKLYDDMKIFIENKELRNVFNNHKKLLKDIVYYIYFNNEIYYEKGLSIYDNIKLLREARLVDEYVEEMLLRVKVWGKDYNLFFPVLSLLLSINWMRDLKRGL